MSSDLVVTLYKNFTQFLLQCVFFSSIHVLYPQNLNNYEVTLNQVMSISRRLQDYSFFAVSYFYNLNAVM